MLAFIGAMELEVQAFLNRMSDVVKHEISNTDFYIGKLAGIKCLVMKSGVAKVASAISTTIMFEHFDIDGVINIGTAGGLDMKEEVLDVVVSIRVAHHDIDVPNWDVGFDQERNSFSANKKMIDVLKTITSESDRIWFGDIVTGDCLIYRDDQIQKIIKDYPTALCAEMEGASIAQVCKHYNCPFVIIRSLSDIAHKEGNELSFSEYAAKASSRSALWCEKFIQVYVK